MQPNSDMPVNVGTFFSTGRTCRSALKLDACKRRPVDESIQQPVDQKCHTASHCLSQMTTLALLIS